MTGQVQTQTVTSRGSAVPLVLEEQKKGQGLWAEAFKRLRRNRMAVMGLIIITCLILCAIFADFLAPKPYDLQVLKDNNAIPSWLPYVFTTVRPAGSEGGYAKVNDAYAFGADYVGRDILSRLIYGTRISLAVAFVGPLMSLLIGILLGSVAGFYGGWRDQLIMRVVDLMYSFPSILMIILMMAFFRSSFANSQPGSFAFTMNKVDAAFGGLLFIFIGIGITSWENMARLARGQVLAVRQREYVVAAESIGMNRRTILIRHVLPNILGPLIVAETLAIPAYISTEAFLSFIGLGVNRPTPSWGSMIADGSAGIRSYPNQAIFPALALALAMFAFNFLGDGLRDALDPRLRGVD
jgi:oligopeptide transport system permease protein